MQTQLTIFKNAPTKYTLLAQEYGDKIRKMCNEKHENHGNKITDYFNCSIRDIVVRG